MTVDLSGSKALPRLFYLAVEHQVPLPPKFMMKYAPQADLLKAGAATGVIGAGVQLRIRKSQLQELYRLGSKPNRGTPQEFRIILAECISQAIDEVRDDLSFEEYLGLIKALNEYVNPSGEQVVQYEEVSLGGIDLSKVSELPKFQSGYTTIDRITGGLYQGILLLIMKPGGGKTSHMLRLAELLREQPDVSDVWFFEAEIPKTMMVYRMKPQLLRTKWRKSDRLVCGFVDINQIVRECIDRKSVV